MYWMMRGVILECADWSRAKEERSINNNEKGGEHNDEKESIRGKGRAQQRQTQQRIVILLRHILVLPEPETSKSSSSSINEKGRRERRGEKREGKKDIGVRVTYRDNRGR
jgi:hypothetical protein